MKIMETKIWRMVEGKNLRELLREAAYELREGRLVAFPTETVYGLGANAQLIQAVERIFQAKGRPADNPLIVHVASRTDVDLIALVMNDTEERLMQQFWPGPLTLVLRSRPGAVAPRVTAGLDTVAVRIPANPIARELIALAGVPVAAPSANRSGRPSPTRAEHVRDDLWGRIEGIVDGGVTAVGLESTVVMVDSARAVHVLRPGAVTAEQLRAAGFALASAASPAAARATPASAPRSPGVKYTHYAPRGRLCVVQGAADVVRGYIHKRVATDAAHAKRTAVLAFADDGALAAWRADLVIALAERGDIATAAQQLYAALRTCDDHDIASIYTEAVEPVGLGEAYMNRLRKAAADHIISL
jgi:L-threonylcarbamoyladenylate synthase